MRNNLSRLLMMSFFAGGLFLTSCNKDDVATPTVAQVTPQAAPSSSVLTVTGSGLRDIQSIMFDNGDVPVSFTTTFNTDGAILFRVPKDAIPGQQNIVFTNAAGKTFSVPFKVLALAGVSSVWPNDFQAGSTITLTGNNFATVTKVAIAGTTSEATVVSKTATQLVVQMPASALPKVSLSITNDAGSMTTSNTFNNLDETDHQLIIYTEAMNSPSNDWSWCNDHKNSADFFVNGANSYLAKYSKGSWAALSIHFDPQITTNNYGTLTFYVKGGATDQLVDVASEQGGTTNTITVPANVWTFYSMPVNGFISGLTMERLDFKMHGPDDADQTVYFDNILLLK